MPAGLTRRLTGITDRFGRRLSIGWPEHQLVWIEAANTLATVEQALAFNQIAEMTGRSYQAVYFKAREMRQDALDRRYAATKAARASA